MNFGKTLLIWHTLSSCTFNTPPLSPSVTINKPVNRIFQSSCGVQFAREIVSCCQIPAVQWKMVTVGLVIVVSAYQQHAVCCLTLHSTQLSSPLFRGTRKNKLTNLPYLILLGTRCLPIGTLRGSCSNCKNQKSGLEGV